MFNLSGAINVLLFLIVRPQLLLFSRISPPEEFSEPEVELEGPGNSVALSRVDSRPSLDDI